MSDPLKIDQIDKHKPTVDAVGIISEILSNLSDLRDVIRELLSNSSAKEVNATNVTVKIYESYEGLSFTIEDDGIGMNYTRDNENPGRLDKFLNIAQGRQSGFGSDEFGAKGLGTILLYNSRQVEIETWDGGEFAYRVILLNPRHNILQEKKLVEPIVYSIPSLKNPLAKRGTKITIKGWAEKDGISKEFRIHDMERYLRYYTVVGYTKSLRERVTSLPNYELYIGRTKKNIQAGFNYILPSENTDDPKTVVFDPITIAKTTSNNHEVKIILKGGITTESKKNKMSDLTGGVWLSLNGIPYVKMSKNRWARRLNLTDDFVRFVVECDDVRLNLSRNDINRDEYYEAFIDALVDAFDIIKENNDFQTFYRNRHKELRIAHQKYMTYKKEKFLSTEQQYVWYKDKRLIGEPESEQDVAALTWILEGLNGLPFHFFQTLQYPGYLKGIDLLINIQEKEESQKLICVYAEIERFFSNLIRHKHDVSQMTCALVWKVDKGKIKIGKVQNTKIPWKYSYQVADSHIAVYEISSFPNIFVGTREDYNIARGTIL